MIKCTLKEYLAQINLSYMKVGGKVKPPKLVDIASDTGISYRTVMRIANNQTSKFDYEDGYAIIKSIRARGYDMQLSDLIALRE